jgi:uncharacterized membrane protein
MAKRGGQTMGNRIAPPRFILFVALLVVVSIGAGLYTDWLHAIMIGFDAAALTFLLSCISLLNDTGAAAMRRHAAENDANRAGLLAITGAVTTVILITVGAELLQGGNRSGAAISLIVGTLALAWLFSNLVYALHYAHMFYLKGEHGPGDSGGIDMPGTREPDYWDFVYFSFTLGMTFQTSDTAITSGTWRRVAIFHSFAAFVFNIGVLAFTINVIGGSSPHS